MLAPNKSATPKGGFARDEEGSATIEAAFMIPLIFFVVLSMFVIFDTFRLYATHQKAAYTLSDMISRETLPIDNDYLDGAHAIFDELTRDPQNSNLRFTVVNYQADDDEMRVDWSEVRGNFRSLNDTDVRDWSEILPTMVNNERMIIVETYTTYDPPFATGLGRREIENFIFTRPRYAPQVLFQDLEPEFSS
ncbi:MAG: hypothetical protein WBG95_12980 [Sulfitobacter sp.]